MGQFRRHKAVANNALTKSTVPHTQIHVCVQHCSLRVCTYRTYSPRMHTAVLHSSNDIVRELGRTVPPFFSTHIPRLYMCKTSCILNTSKKYIHVLNFNQLLYFFFITTITPNYKAHFQNLVFNLFNHNGSYPLKCFRIKKVVFDVALLTFYARNVFWMDIFLLFKQVFV